MAFNTACGNGFPLNIGGGTGEGTSDYAELENKPQINEVTLSGNKSLSDLGIAAASDLATLSGVVGDSSDGLVKDVSDLQTTVGDSSAGLVKDVSDIQGVIPSGATSSNKLATASDIPDAVTGNPSGSATAGNLTKLQIGSDVYNVPSGGGGGTATLLVSYDLAAADFVDYDGNKLGVKDFTNSEKTALNAASKIRVIYGRVTDNASSCRVFECSDLDLTNIRNISSVFNIYLTNITATISTQLMSIGRYQIYMSASDLTNLGTDKYYVRIYSLT